MLEITGFFSPPEFPIAKIQIIIVGPRSGRGHRRYVVLRDSGPDRTPGVACRVLLPSWVFVSPAQHSIRALSFPSTASESGCLVLSPSSLFWKEHAGLGKLHVSKAVVLFIPESLIMP